MVRPRAYTTPPTGGKGNFIIRWLGILTLVCFAFSARAALQFDVFLGYEGIVPEASWFPVVCEIKNDGPSFTGTVVVEPSGYNNQDQSRRVVVELPTGTLKRLVLPAFSTARYSSSWDVKLLDEKEKVRGQQLNLRPKKQIAFGTTMMGAIPRTASGVPVIRQGSTAQGEYQPATARLQTAILPDNPITYEGMDCFYLNSEKAAELTINQVNALLAWLNAGGHLIVAVEQITDVNGVPWLRKIVPCDLSDMRTVEGHSELQDWVRNGLKGSVVKSGRNNNVSSVNPFADLGVDSTFEAAPLQVVFGKMRGAAETVVKSGDVPLILASHEGRGLVTTLMFSPEREPVRSWKNLPSFWAKTAEVPLATYVTENSYQRGSWSVDGVFGAMIDSKQVRKLPVGWLLVLLMVYLLVIGPLDQFWLKKLKRPMLTWITFPCYVVLFSLLIYYIGYKLRAGETEWNELHVVDVLKNGEQAELRGRTYASIYSPVNAKYKIENQLHYSTFRGEYVSSWSGAGQKSEEGEVTQTGDNFKADIFVPVWTSQLYVSEWWQTAALPLNFTVASEGNEWVVTVENRLDRTLTSAMLVIGGRVLELKELPAGKPKTFRLGKGQGTTLKEFVWRYGSGFQNAVSRRHQAFGMGGNSQITDLPNSCAAISFVSQLAQTQGQVDLISPPGLDLTDISDRGNAILLAWQSDFSPIKSINQFPTRRSQKNTLWRIAAPVNSELSSL